MFTTPTKLLNHAFLGFIVFVAAPLHAQDANPDEQPPQGEQPEAPADQPQAQQPQQPQRTTRPLIQRELPFMSDDQRFLLRYPNTFQRMKVEEEPVELMLLKREPDSGGTRAQLMVLNPPIQAKDLDAAANEYLDGVKQTMQNLEVLETRQTELAGRPAQLVVVQGQPEQGVQTRTAMVLSLKDGQLYVLAGVSEPQAFDGLRQTFDRMVESFHWNDAAVADADGESPAPEEEAALAREASQPAAVQPAAIPAAAPGTAPPAPEVTPAAAGQNELFTSEEHGLRLSAPRGWTQAQAGRPNVIAAFEAPRDQAAQQQQPAQLHVMVQAPPQPATEENLKAIVQQMTQRIQQSGDSAELVESGAAQLAGSPAHRLVHQREANGTQMRFMQVVSVHSGKIYQLTYVAPAETFQQHLPAAQAAIDSVQWTE